MSLREGLSASAPTGNSQMHIVQRTSKDVLEQAEALPFWSQDYTQLDKGSFRGAVTSVSNKNVQIFRESMNRAVDEIATAPENSYVIGLPTIIEGEAMWGGVPAKKNSLISLNKNAELSFRTSHSSEIAAAVISEQRLEEYASEVEWVDLSQLMKKVHPVELISTNTTSRLLASFFVATEHLSKIGEDANSQNIWRFFEDSLMDTCLQALLQASESRVRPSNYRIHRYIVDRVRDLTLSNNYESLTIGEICTTLRISRRTLNHAFIRVLNITPVEYMRNVRLQRVRAELQSTPHQVTTIANIAYKWGFGHMSLFSRYYRELFGESPSETLERARTL